MGGSAPGLPSALPEGMPTDVSYSGLEPLLALRLCRVAPLTSIVAASHAVIVITGVDVHPTSHGGPTAAMTQWRPSTTTPMLIVFADIVFIAGRIHGRQQSVEPITPVRPRSPAVRQPIQIRVEIRTEKRPFHQSGERSSPTLVCCLLSSPVRVAGPRAATCRRPNSTILYLRVEAAPVVQHTSSPYFWTCAGRS